jgi:hypothetical protein
MPKAAILQQTPSSIGNVKNIRYLYRGRLYLIRIFVICLVGKARFGSMILVTGWKILSFGQGMLKKLHLATIITWQ